MRDWSQAISKVVDDQVLPGLASQRDPAGRPRLIRVEAHIPDALPLDWLRAQPHGVKTFWSDREQAFSMAGIGVAVEYQGDSPVDAGALFSELKGTLSHGFPNARYYGGFRFDPAVEADARWRAFGAYRFVAPRVEIGRKGNQSFVACNVFVEEGDTAAAHVDEVKACLEGVRFEVEERPLHVPKSLSRRDRPDRGEWETRVQDLLQTFREGRTEKVVLARESFYEFEEDLDPLTLLARLMKSTGYSFHFCFQLGPSLAFIGASPERLYKRQNTYLQSEALAGTRPRGATPEEDAALGKELLRCDKERREQRYVVDHIKGVFDRYCRAVRGDGDVELLILRHCQHLLSRMEGMLTRSELDGVLLQELHPTPAVGGVPVDTSLELIHALEPFDRGWYAGPVGYVAYDGTEFAVAIRSGLVMDNTLCLHSGAGILEGSVPDEEWDEIENKMRNFLNIIERGRPVTIPPEDQ